MSASALRQIPFESSQTPESSSWDAATVWHERVRRGKTRPAASLPPAPGWDPYQVWLKRVKRNP